MLSILDAAKILYAESTANHPTIHCNRFPSWNELPLDQQQYWIAKAVATNSGVISSDNIAR